MFKFLSFIAILFLIINMDCYSRKKIYKHKHESKPYDTLNNIGAEFYLGGGGAPLAGGPYSNLDANYFWSFSCSLLMRDFSLEGCYVYGEGYTNHDVDQGPNRWENNSKYRMSIYKVALGYTAFDFGYSTITPSIGYAGISVGPVQRKIDKDKYLESFVYKYTDALNMGIAYDMRIFESDIPTLPKTARDKNFGSLRLKYEVFLPKFELMKFHSRGVIHSFSIGLTIFGGF